MHNIENGGNVCKCGMGVNGTGTILFLAQTDTLGRRLDDDRGINNARQNGGGCTESYYENR